MQDGYEFVDPTAIIRVESEGNYSTVFFTDGKELMISKNLKYLEDRLINLNFFRPHNSHLINCSYIAKYQRVDGGLIEMGDGFQVPLSRRKKEHFLQLMKNWR